MKTNFVPYTSQIPVSPIRFFLRQCNIAPQAPRSEKDVVLDQRPNQGFKKAYFATRLMLVLGGLLLALAAGGKASASQMMALSWGVSTTPGVSGYALYCGTNSSNYVTRIDVGTNTTVNLTGLREGKTNYFAVAAYNSAGIEGLTSGQISYIVPGALVALGKPSPGSPMQMKFPVAIGHSYDIQASVDLQNWATISTIPNSTSNAWYTFQDPQSASFAKRFYRLILH